MSALKESSPEDDSQADVSNTASLYKVPEHVFIKASRFKIKTKTKSENHWVFFVVVIFLQVSDATGSMKLTKVSEKSPFAKDLLVRDDCFILDNGANGKIFVWKGERVKQTKHYSK